MILLLAACDTTVRFPPDLWQWEMDSGLSDSGTTPAPPTRDEPTRFTLAGGGCDAEGTSFSWSFRTNGWTLSSTLLIYANGNEEEHALVLVGTDPDGAWDALSLGPLPDGVTAEEHLPGVNTRFDCADEAALTYVARVRDPSGALSDCIAWGADPAGAIAQVRDRDPDVTTLGGCRAWKP